MYGFVFFALIFSLAKQKGVLTKMWKTTNKLQANPNIACGYYKGSREPVLRFWGNAETEVNFMGPPSKGIAGWKKVWADKKSVRQKVAQNFRDKKFAGRGPSKEHSVSLESEFVSLDDIIEDGIDGQRDMAKNSYSALQAEPEVQRDLLQAIQLVASKQDELEKTTRKIYISLDKINENNKKHFVQIEKIILAGVEEMRRHNAFMEKPRLKEVKGK